MDKERTEYLSKLYNLLEAVDEISLLIKFLE